ncbi:MAG TPA: LysR family transcriptional regulator [Burkholderiaceae bacterium]|nr:LysR family transcriptional regulator [Burkholderiaceae bacterium]
MAIDLRQLRHLLALAEHKNFSRAADAVHLTQPALSRSIQALEASVGAPLFERTRGAIEPTEIGRLVLRHARSLNASAGDLEREIRLAKGLDLGELRVGVGPFGGSALIGPVAGRLSRLHPKLRLHLIVAPWGELPERARARDVDLVVAELTEISVLDDFESQGLANHRVFVACRPRHPLTGRAERRLEDVFSYPLAGPRLPERVTRALLAATPPAGRTALARAGPLTIECDSSSVLKSILKESDAVSMMPRFMFEDELRTEELVMLPSIDVPVQIRFGAAWVKQRSLAGAGARFVELLRAHDAELARREGGAVKGARAGRHASARRAQR